MIGYLADRAVWSGGRAFFRLLARQHRENKANRKPTTLRMWAYVLILPFFVAAVANTALHNGGTALWFWGLTAACVLITAAGAHGKTLPAASPVLAKYQPLPDVMTPEDMRARAQLLKYAETANPETGQSVSENHLPNTGSGKASASWHLGDAAYLQLLLDGLFSVQCPELTCKAEITVPCNMGIAVPVVLVQKNPPLFCHTRRIAAAVAAGTVNEEDLLAQFGERAGA
jgi:hypothetical protein